MGLPVSPARAWRKAVLPVGLHNPRGCRARQGVYSPQPQHAALGTAARLWISMQPSCGLYRIAAYFYFYFLINYFYASTLICYNKERNTTIPCTHNTKQVLAQNTTSYKTCGLPTIARPIPIFHRIPSSTRSFPKKITSTRNKMKITIRRLQDLSKTQLKE